MHDQFYVYRGSGGSPITVPLVILTAKAERPNSWYGEYFLLISGPRTCCVWKDQRVDGTGVPEDVYRVDERWILDEIAQQAQNFVKLASASHIQSTGHNAPQAFTLQPADPGALAQTWLRGEFKNEIASIMGITKADSLRDYLKALQTATPVVVTAPPYKSPFQ